MVNADFIDVVDSRMEIVQCVSLDTVDVLTLSPLSRSGESTEFLLFDGATGFHGHTKAGALYYTNSLEHSVACIET